MSLNNETYQSGNASLSLCMIVKNEESFIDACLTSVAGVANQIVIVDTGSSDKTLDIARKYQAEIYSFKWVDDFSAARNFSIEKAKSDWILWLDADERLDPDSIPYLNSCLKYESTPVIYKVHIRNKIKGQGGYKLSSAHRLFTNHKGIRFTGRIHEQVSPSTKRLNGEERNSQVYLEHLGYALEEQEQNKKTVRNQKLLENMVDEEPENAYVHYTLAQNYAMSGKHEQANRHYQIALQLGTFDQEMTASLLNTLSENLFILGEKTEAKVKAMQSINLVPEQVGAYYLIYRIEESVNDFKAAAHWLEQVLQKNKQQKNALKKISTDVIIDEDKIFYTLGVLYVNTAEYKKAEKCFQKVDAHSEVAKNPVFLKRKAEVHLKTGQLAEAESVLNNLHNTSQRDDRYTELLGRVLMGLRKFEKARHIYQNLLQSDPDNQYYAKMLAGTYAKLGNVDAATDILRQINQT